MSNPSDVQNEERDRSNAEQWLMREELNAAGALWPRLTKMHVGGGLAFHGQRNIVAACCFNICVEHACAVAHLFETRFDGSAMALVRSVFESYVRGVWIYLCATDAKVESFVEGALRVPPFRCLIDAIEKKDAGFSKKTLSNLRLRSWDAMNAYTHTGHLQIARRIRDGEMASSYGTGEIVEAIRCCMSLGLLAAQHSYIAADDLSRASEFIEVMRDYSQGCNKRARAFHLMLETEDDVSVQPPPAPL